MPHHDTRTKHRHPLPRKHPWALGILAKEPRPGLVKTRLTPPLSPAAASHIYQSSLGETVTNMASVPCDCFLFYSGAVNYFRQNFPDLTCVPQATGDLGTRLDNALATLLTSGYQAAALIGSDSPDLPRDLVINAFTALSTASAVTIPAADGGYVLIGERQHCPALFRDIPWSSSGVLAATRRQADLSGVDLREVGSWEDFDDAASLARLIVRSPHSVTARLVLAEYSHLLSCETISHHQAVDAAGKGPPAG